MARKASNFDVDALRAAHAPTHPLLTGADFTFITPAMKMSWEVVLEDVQLGRTSCVQVASPRYGKTEASIYVANRLVQEFPATFVFWFDAQYYRESLPSEKRFFGDLLQTAGHSLATTHDTERRKSRVIELFWTSAVERGGNRVIIVIDEIQELKPPHLRWLRDVWNVVKHRGIKLQIVGFGQNQAVTLKNALKVAGEEGLISRFLSHVVLFQGLTCAKDFEEVGDAFDTTLQHPADSGLSFTQFMLPMAFGQGFRMREQGQAAFNAFCNATPRPPVNVGMEWVVLAYRAFLRYAVDGAPPQRVDDRAWRFAVESARYVESLSYTAQ